MEDLRNRARLGSNALPSVSFYSFVNTHNRWDSLLYCIALFFPSSAIFVSLTWDDLKQTAASSAPFWIFHTCLCNSMRQFWWGHSQALLLKCLLTASSNGGNGCLQSELCINICRWCIGCRRFFWLISQGLISLQVLHSWDTWGGSHVWLGVGQLWKVIEEFLAFVPVPISSPATCVKDSSQLKHLGSSVISEPDWMLNWKPKSVSYFCAHGMY